MFSLFWQHGGKSSRGQSYYERENMVHTLDDLISIGDPVATQHYSTAETIKFNSLILNEVDEKSIIKMFGKPKHIIQNEGLQNHKVLFYRHSAGEFIFLMQFHFLKNKFFLISNMISAQRSLSTSDKETFINRITNKYFPEMRLDFKSGFDIKISDKFKNFIKVVDGVNFRVNYINISSFKQLLQSDPKYIKGTTEGDFESKIENYF